MDAADIFLYGAALAAYALAMGVMSFGLVFQREKPWETGGTLMTIGFFLHTMSLIMRWVISGHVPTVSNFENTNVAAWFIMLFLIYFYHTQKEFRVSAVFGLPVAVLTMGFGLMSSKENRPMVASLKTFWLVLHVFFAWLVTGALTFAAAASVLYLLKEKKQRTGAMTPFYEKLPSLERIDELIYRNIIFGFICYAVMIGSGALWAKDLWGAYWSWDPVETSSLISWMIYGLILHFRFTFGWRGRATAWMCIGALVTVFIVMFGVNLVMESSMHVFNIQ